MAQNSAKCKNMMYTQQIPHLPAKSKDKLVERIEKKLSAKKYAVILHDKDIDENGKPVAEHIHAMLSFTNARSVNSVAKSLGDKPQYVEAWSGNSNNGYAYLCHRTKDARDKFQYDTNIVTANFDYSALLDSITTEVAEAKSRSKSKTDQLLDALYEGSITREEIEHFLSGSQYAKAKKHIDNICAKRLERQAAEWRNEMKAQGRQVRVIWIYGTTGTGKTSLAKELARKAGQNFYISGSSRDLFQNYAGQHTLILDEFRPKSIAYHDLLRITDPFAISEQVAPSRYFDKSIAADLIIITSPYNPHGYYQMTFDGEKAIAADSFDQLERRISLALKMDENTIEETAYNFTTERYEPVQGNSRPNLYSSANRPPPTQSSGDLFHAMLD